MTKHRTSKFANGVNGFIKVFKGAAKDENILESIDYDFSSESYEFQFEGDNDSSAISSSSIRADPPQSSSNHSSASMVEKLIIPPSSSISNSPDVLFQNPIFVILSLYSTYSLLWT